ncbi:hypothetical protein Q7C_1931 [Methylophaga frappieri]|uniref:Uncharacterized protein n=1 Tax=Methylophaga frappieri (strain ATCC BAA-2434 / DSM 25690 / JAM7) TaxID=754477 RepID=I1YJH9_METFJ|nr:hypothetical protein Q7C_1931 [Methylophaga frappieri]
MPKKLMELLSSLTVPALESLNYMDGSGIIRCLVVSNSALGMRELPDV